MNKRPQLQGNDETDRLAEESSNALVSNGTPEPVVPLAVGLLPAIIYGNTRNLHKEAWLNRTDCRQTKTVIYGPS